MIVFGFKLDNAQVDAICTLFYKKRDLLLLTKTGFGKNLIFQLIPFLLSTPRFVLTLMLLKLLQVEHSEMINYIPYGKGIVLNGKNNIKQILANIWTGDYTYVFTSPEIAFSKKFKQSILDTPFFTNCLCLFAINKIYLIEEWGKNFCLIYSEIEKVRKQIPYHVFLLGVLAILTKIVQSCVLEKAGFLPNYHLMQTSLDRPKIMHIHHFMGHFKSGCLDFQFILLLNAKKAKDIQKTIIFVNSINEIWAIIDIIHAWIMKLGYSKEYM